MKTLLIAALVLSSLLLVAEELPPDARAAKMRYELAVEKADLKLIADLKEAKGKALRTEDLQSAKAIEKEIRTLEGTPESRLFQKLTSGKWEYRANGAVSVFEFNQDGTYLNKKGERLRWQIEGDRMLVIHYDGGGECRWEMPETVDGPIKGHTSKDQSIRWIRPL